MNNMELSEEGILFRHFPPTPLFQCSFFKGLPAVHLHIKKKKKKKSAKIQFIG